MVEKVPGLFYFDDTIDPEYSKNLIKKIDENEWIPIAKSENSRRVQHYGYFYDYNSKNIFNKTTKIPDYLKPLIDILTLLSKNLEVINSEYIFNQVIINEYIPGQGISAHTDVKEYGEVIGCFTIGSGSIMTFTNPENKEKIDIYVKPESLYIMTEDSRYKWKHEMASRKTDIISGKKINRNRRISITFRNVKDVKDVKENKKMGLDITKTVVTLTFGDQAENHVGMEQIGKLAEIGDGFNYKDFKKIEKLFNNIGGHVDFYNLQELSEISEIDDEAYLIVLRNGVDLLFKDIGSNFDKKKMFEEQAFLEFDKKAFMYGRVVNKSARWNLCFDEKSREPDYENGNGRIISFEDVPVANTLYKNFEYYFGEKAKDLKGEGNYYFDITKCGIGFHGDSERRKVVAIRLGSSLPIHYQWYKDGNEVGKRIIVPLDGGDIYLMSEKAVGTDWKRKKNYTLRHAVGYTKFT